MRHRVSLDSQHLSGYGERRMNPAVSVHHIGWDLLNNAVNGVANILPENSHDINMKLTI